METGDRLLAEWHLDSARVVGAIEISSKIL